jgi:hypothetical protein
MEVQGGAYSRKSLGKKDAYEAFEHKTICWDGILRLKELSEEIQYISDVSPSCCSYSTHSGEHWNRCCQCSVDIDSS